MDKTQLRNKIIDIIFNTYIVISTTILIILLLVMYQL